MRLAFGFFVSFLTVCPLVASADDVQTLGIGRLFTNDYLGDGSDRWRTGSYAVSILRGDPSATYFREYRLQNQIISPDGRADDRAYAGVITAGVANHWLEGPMHYVLGADVVIAGPQTGLDVLQARFHDTFDMPEPFTENQVADSTTLSVRASATLTSQISENVSIRPFIDSHAGAEDIFRVGADLLFGPVGQSDIWLRDDVTGQPYRGTTSDNVGISYAVGADVGRVGGSIYLSDDTGPDPVGQRRRARAGVHWQPAEETSLFYGVTYLSEEFEGQSEGQVVGSLTLNFSF